MSDSNQKTQPESEVSKASVLSNVANILGVSGTREGQEETVDVEQLKAMGVQPDRHPFLYYWGFLAATAAFVIAATVGMIQYVKLSIQDEVRSKQLAVKDTQLEDLMAATAKTNTSYDVVDADKGLYRIPVAEAMKAIAADPARLRDVHHGSHAPQAVASATDPTGDNSTSP